jgi:hypothetical protein
LARVLLTNSDGGQAMKGRMPILAGMPLAAALVLLPANVYAQQTAPAPQHEEHHPDATQSPSATTAGPHANMMDMMSRMKATDAKLAALVQKMNEAKGSAKTDAIAELLTALVDDRRTMCEPMMANMMTMMTSHGQDETMPMMPKK